MYVTDTSTLFLSAKCFQTSYEHLSEEETKRSVKGYLAYLNDKTNLISNPGIKVPQLNSYKLII